jgi:hypothetical protein
MRTLTWTGTNGKTRKTTIGGEARTPRPAHRRTIFKGYEAFLRAQRDRIAATLGYKGDELLPGCDGMNRRQIRRDTIITRRR